MVEHVNDSVRAELLFVTATSSNLRKYEMNSKDNWIKLVKIGVCMC